jgi:hypothetical protein
MHSKITAFAAFHLLKYPTTMVVKENVVIHLVKTGDGLTYVVREVAHKEKIFRGQIEGIFIPEMYYFYCGHWFILEPCRRYYKLNEVHKAKETLANRKVILRKVIKTIKGLHKTGQSGLCLDPKHVKLFLDRKEIEPVFYETETIGVNKKESTDLYGFLRLMIWVLFDCWVEFAKEEEFWNALDQLKLPIEEDLFNFMAEVLCKNDPVDLELSDHYWFDSDNHLAWTRSWNTPNECERGSLHLPNIRDYAPKVVPYFYDSDEEDEFVSRKEIVEDDPEIAAKLVKLTGKKSKEVLSNPLDADLLTFTADSKEVQESKITTITEPRPALPEEPFDSKMDKLTSLYSFTLIETLEFGNGSYLHRIKKLDGTEGLLREFPVSTYTFSMKIPGVACPERTYKLGGHSFFTEQSRPYFVLSEVSRDFAPEGFKKEILQKVLEAIKAVHSTGQSSIILNPDTIRVFNDNPLTEIELAGTVNIGFKNMEISDLYNFLSLQIWFLFDCWIEFTDIEDFWNQLDYLNLPIKECLFNFMSELVNEVEPIIQSENIVDHLWFNPLGWTRFFKDRFTPLTDYPLLTRIKTKLSLQTNPVDSSITKEVSNLKESAPSDSTPEVKLPKKKKGCLRGLVSSLKKVVKKLFK